MKFNEPMGPCQVPYTPITMPFLKEREKVSPREKVSICFYGTRTCAIYRVFGLGDICIWSWTPIQIYSISNISWTNSFARFYALSVLDITDAEILNTTLVCRLVCTYRELVVP